MGFWGVAVILDPVRRLLLMAQVGEVENYFLFIYCWISIRLLSSSMLLVAYWFGCVTLSPPPTPSPFFTPCVISNTRVQATWKCPAFTVAIISGKSAVLNPRDEYAAKRAVCRFSGEYWRYGQPGSDGADDRICWQLIFPSAHLKRHTPIP